MTVRELMRLMTALDPELPVVVAGYEDGADWVQAVRKVTLGLDANSDWWSGQHQILAPKGLADDVDTRGAGDSSAWGGRLQRRPPADTIARAEAVLIGRARVERRGEGE